MADDRLFRVIVLGGLSLISAAPAAAVAGVAVAGCAGEPPREGPPPPREGPPPPWLNATAAPAPEVIDAGAPETSTDVEPIKRLPPREGPPPPPREPKTKP